MKTIIIAYQCGHRSASDGYFGREAAELVIRTALRCPVCREEMPPRKLGDALSFARACWMPHCVACGAVESPDNPLRYVEEPGESGWLCVDDDACLARMRGDGEELVQQYDSEVPW